MTPTEEVRLNLAGATRYLDDLSATAGMLFGSPLTSPCARGALKSVDARKALALDPSVRVLTARDIPGENQIGENAPDECLLVSGEWSYKGQALALALASSPGLARKAAALVSIEYDELVPVVDARAAAAAGDLIMSSRTMRSGDPEAAFERSAVVVEGKVESGAQEHVYLETQGAIAECREGRRIHLVSGTQSPTGVQRVVARVLGLPMNCVEVEARRLGGAFGGKEDQAAQWAALAALGAASTGRTVKVYLSRREDISWTGKRHPYSSDFKMGLDAEGNILAFEADYYQNSGACCDLSPAVLSRTLFHAASAYRVPNVRVTGTMCRTNLPPFTAFRGFGAPQGVFVFECALDAAARKGGWDPVELRRRNLLAEGDVLHYGQSAADCRALSCFDRALELSRWDELKSGIASFNAAHLLEKRGAAILPICFGVSFTKLMMNQGGALVHVYSDGSVSVSTGAVEMGQQVSRKVQVVAARALGIDDSLVRVEPTRTGTVANTFPTAASTGSDINGMAALVACEEIRGRLLALASRELGIEAGELGLEAGRVVHVCSKANTSIATALGWEELVERAHAERVDISAHGFYATPGLVYDLQAERGSPFAYHVYGCAVVAATLDVLRGTYRFDEAYLVHDSGDSIDREVDLGQIEGGFAQGLGWAALEDLRYDEKGTLLSDSLSTYKLPDIRFMPPTLKVEFLEGAPNPKAVLRSKAIGEPPLLYGIAGYFAVLDALRAAGEASEDFERFAIRPADDAREGSRLYPRSPSMIFRNGLVALPGESEFRRASIRVRGERVAEVAQSLEPQPGEETVDASALLVLPGAIDPHVHFDEPGFTSREDFRHGSSEAARGGVTTVIDMPCTSLPPVIDAAALDNKLAHIRKSAVVDFALYGGVSGHAAAASIGSGGGEGAMAQLAPRVVGFKCYFISGMETFTRVTHEDFARIVAEGERLGRPILLHAEDLDYVTAATARVKAARGTAKAEWSDYADSRPEAAELAAVATALALASGRESFLHIVHVGTAAAAELAHAAGATCETCAHYLAFGREDFAQKGAALKTAPVVKSRAERERLWSLLSDGSIDFLASDHAPSSREEKETGDVWTAYGGIPGTGTLFIYLYSEGLVRKRLGLPRFLEASSGAAARRYGLDARKGSIAPGKDADLVLVDPSGSTLIEGKKLLSKGKITPFEGMSFPGAIAATYVRGRLVYDAASGIVAEPGYGRFLTWGYT